jgi:hypothetical protein
MPNDSPESDFKDKIHHTAYPCVELAGVIWTFMGPPQNKPRIPDFEWMRLPASHRFVSKTYEACNYLQGLEGGFDLSHTSFLHREFDEDSMRTRSPAVKVVMQSTDFGFFEMAGRKMEEHTSHVRATMFAMPFHQLRSFDGYPGMTSYARRGFIQGHMWIPIDDECQWVYNWMYAKDGSALSDEEIEQEEVYMGRGPEDLLPGYKPKRNKSNNYLIDREVQRAQDFTGIHGINTQDFAIQESMGSIADRSQEHLCASDVSVIAIRRLLIQAARDVEAGRDLLGCDGGSSYVTRPSETLLPDNVAWYETMKDDLVARW